MLVSVGVVAKQSRLEHKKTKIPRNRHIPAEVRRQVWTRDGARCRYVNDDGRRCAETARLELHHRVPYANGGLHVAENLELRCHAHNDLAAEQDFGREHMALMKGTPTAMDPRQRVFFAGGSPLMLAMCSRPKSCSAASSLCAW